MLDRARGLLAQTRDVDWVVAIHGMNTNGAWQEDFTWHFSTTWGHSVPVAIYKYGLIIAGVALSWRRRTLLNGLRTKIATLCKQAHAHGFRGHPDVIAHSFGTWLLGHILKEELMRPEEEQFRFGRIILTGCILRPDFDWEHIKEAGLVEDVLNHYGSKDAVVPWAQLTISDSSPSGRRGFDGDQVVNILAAGYGHSDVFSVDKWIADGKLSKAPGRGAERGRLLEHSYHNCWRPFLLLPKVELTGLPGRTDPDKVWRPLPWPLRGNLFPFLAFPCVLSLAGCLAGAVGDKLGWLLTTSWPVFKYSSAGLLLTMIVGRSLMFFKIRQDSGSDQTNILK